MTVSRVMRLLFAVVATLTALAHAQQAKEQSKHPGDTVKFEVRFDGPDASKIKTIYFQLRSKTNAPPDQVGFNGALTSTSFSPVSPNVFQPEVKIADNTLSGDYFLQIYVQADPGETEYEAGKQFQLPTIHIENHRTFTPPALTVKERP